MLSFSVALHRLAIRSFISVTSLALRLQIHFRRTEEGKIHTKKKQMRERLFGSGSVALRTSYSIIGRE